MSGEDTTYPLPQKNFQKYAKLTINILSYVKKETCRTYLSWLQSASINSAKSSFAKQILFTERICCLFHFPECENWSMVPFCVLGGLIFELPKLHRFINPWKVEEHKRVCVILGLASPALVPRWNQSERHNGYLLFLEFDIILCLRIKMTDYIS